MKNRKSDNFPPNSFERNSVVGNDIAELARRVDDAALRAEPIAQLTESCELSLATAYDIQYSSVRRRVSRGETIVGLKMGFTSREKAEQMGVHELIYGYLTDRMLIPNGGTVALAQFIHPRAEPELAVRLSRPLAGRPSWQEAWEAVECVATAIEIIDSRFRDFKFSLADVVADNSSSSALVLGAWVDPPADPSSLAMEIRFNDRPVARGSTANVMGNPAIAVATAARMLSERNRRLEPGWIVMTGGATAAVVLEPGARVVADAEGIGQVAFVTTDS